MITYITDGSFNGLLTAIFDYFERKEKIVRIFSEKNYQAAMFEKTYYVETDVKKSERVWNGLLKKCSIEQRTCFYYAFLADSYYPEQLLLDYAILLFTQPAGFVENAVHPIIQDTAKRAKQVSRERHRMTAFVRFRKSDNGVYTAIIKPDFDVLPVIAEHFKNRYADQQWLIYDEQRKYGILYDLQTVQEVRLSPVKEEHLPVCAIFLATDEIVYQELWKAYFQHTNIKERKNSKLHLQHVPKRYWRYLTEKY